MTAFTLTRTFDAPRTLVWRAWTDPTLTARWWHPDGVDVDPDSVSIDLRPNGQYTYTMTLGDESWPTTGTYLEIREPERLRFTWRGPEDSDDACPLATVILEELDERSTRMTFTLERMVEDPAETEDVRDGWGSAFDDVLAPLLGELSRWSPRRRATGLLVRAPRDDGNPGPRVAGRRESWCASSGRGTPRPCVAGPRCSLSARRRTRAQRWRRARKKSRSRSPHSCSRTPSMSSTRWFRRGSRTRSYSDPAAPAFGSAAPTTRRAIRARTIAPAHMVHGSRVTASVQPVRFHRPVAAAARRRARISA